MHDFQIGKIYNRARDIHTKFGGQLRSGIVTPSKHPIIFIFTGKGKRHGYEDKWSSDGTFRYFGEGQTGNMKLIKGNKAIANQIADGKDLLLFEILRKGQIRFVGPFNCAEYSTEKGRDTKGNIRDAIVFHLVPAEDEAPELIEATGVAKSLNELRKSAYASAGPSQKKHGGNARRSYHVRSEEVRIYVLARADGNCESCLEPAPFKKSNGEPYLEPHHIRRLTDGGPDNPAFMGAVCPNCHREIHHGAHGKTTNAKLQQRVTVKEIELEGVMQATPPANLESVRSS